MRRSFLVLLFLCVPAAFAQSEAPARQLLQQCADSLEPDVVGIEAIEAACPGVTHALDELGVSDLVSEFHSDLLKRDGLGALLALVERYEQPPEREAIGLDSLSPVLDSLRKPPPPEVQKSWYERFKEWLRQNFKQPDAQSDPWLVRWLEEHPMPEVVRWILIYGVMLLVVVLAILIVVNEVRAAAPGRRRKRSTTTQPGEHPVLPDDSEQSDAGGERPSALLKMLIATLVKTGRVQGAHALTHRELSKRARFDDSTQRDSFQKIAQLAEREVFGGKVVASAELDELLRAGRSLDAQLNGAPT